MSRFAKPNEYSLPANDIPEWVRLRLHPWIAGFIGMSQEQANLRVAERWSTIERPSLQALRDTLSHFSVEAIIDCKDGGMIRAFRATDEKVIIGDFWYMPAPLGSEEIVSRLVPSHTQSNDSLREFLVYFGGLAEDTAVAGNFVYRDPWPLFIDSWDGAIEGFDEWMGSLMLFHARNGCFVLVRNDGKVAWWIFQECRVEVIADNFDEFILQFAKHREASWPFDPYGR
jgi:hypothetical protein